MKCEICNIEINYRFINHLRKHNILPQKYYDKYLKKENENICFCGNKTNYSKNMDKGYNKTCSRGCSNKIVFSSDSVKQKMIESNKISQAKRWSDVELRRKYSIRMSNRYIDEPESFVSSYKTGYYFSKKNNCKIYYASSYEKQAFNILELLDEVRYFNRCKFSIDYMNPTDSKMHKYIPDIEVIYRSGKRQIIEIKPDRLLDDETVMAKASAAQTHCDANDLNYTIWTEKDLN